MTAALTSGADTMPAPAPATVPMPDDLRQAGETVADDVLASAVRSDANTMRAAKGGAHAKFEPRAWSYGGQVD